jgi:hypothetical protein
MILLEASAWGLRAEVEISAEGYLSEGHSAVDSYQYAYDDWIK